MTQSAPIDPDLLAAKAPKNTNKDRSIRCQFEDEEETEDEGETAEDRAEKAENRRHQKMVESIQNLRLAASVEHVKAGRPEQALKSIISINPRQGRSSTRRSVDPKAMREKATSRKSSGQYEDRDHPDKEVKSRYVAMTPRSTERTETGAAAPSYEMLTNTELWEAIENCTEGEQVVPAGWDDFLHLIDQKEGKQVTPWEACGLKVVPNQGNAPYKYANLRSYDGEGEDFNEYLTELLSIGSAEGWTPLQSGVVLRTQLRGKALRIADTLEPPITRYNIYALMRQLFGYGLPLKFQIQIFKDKFRVLEQQAHQTLQDWGLEVLEKGNQAYLTDHVKKEDKMLDKFIQNMTDKQLGRMCAGERLSGRIKTLPEMIRYATQVNLEAQVAEENVSSKSTYQLRSCDRVFMPQTTDYQVSLPRQEPRPSNRATAPDNRQQLVRGMKAAVDAQPRQFHERMRKDLKTQGHVEEKREAATEPMAFCPGACWKCGRKGHKFRECAVIKSGLVGFVTASCRAPGETEATPCVCPCVKHAIPLTQEELSAKCNELTDRYAREGTVHLVMGTGIQEPVTEKPKSSHAELKKDLKKKKPGRDQPPKPR